MRKIIYLVLISTLLFGLMGCSTKTPINVDKEFYSDMVKCLDLTKKTLETKNTKYNKEIGNLIIKHTEEDYFNMIVGDVEISEKSKNNYGLNEKEQEILSSVTSLSFDLSSYMNGYFDNRYKADVLIDTDTLYGERLLKSIQKTISIMEIDYQFKNE